MTATVLRRPKYQLPKDTERNWFTEKFEKTLNMGFSVTMVVVGKRTGISKTYGTARMAECLDPKGFTAKDVEDGKYTFYAQKFIEQIKNIDYYRWVLFDEPGRQGSGGNRQEWQSDANKALSSTCQISRFKVPVAPFILPHRNFLASQIFALANLMIVFNERGKAKVYRIEVSEFDGSVFTPYEGSLNFGFPDNDLIEAIEQAKSEMFMKDVTNWTKKMEISELHSKTSSDIADEIIQNKLLDNYIVVKDGIKSTVVGDIMKNYKIGASKAYEVKRVLDAELRQEPTDTSNSQNS